MNHQERQGCLASLMQAFGFAPQPASRLVEEFTQEEDLTEEEPLPYHIRDDFLSPAELNFYRVLRAITADWASVCPKVSLGDLFYAQTGDYATNTTYRNKIDRKHVDFLLCDAQSLRPLVGIELDDASHRWPSRRERDEFVKRVFQSAGLPLLRIRVQATYNTRAMSISLRDWAGIHEPAAEEEASTAGGTGEALADAERNSQQGSPATQSLAAAAPPACPKCGQPMVIRIGQKQGPHFAKKFWGCPDFPRCRGMRDYAAAGGSEASI